VYTAGQVSIDERGTLIGAGDLAAQTAQAMRNVGFALAAAGADYADIVKITTYVVNYKPEHRAVIGLARSAFISNGTPPRALSSASALWHCRSGSSRSKQSPLSIDFHRLSSPAQVLQAFDSVEARATGVRLGTGSDRASATARR
jgi:enamine deaminase RidA (YjgF/YER057c/UK114 family)